MRKYIFLNKKKKKGKQTSGELYITLP